MFRGSQAEELYASPKTDFRGKQKCYPRGNPMAEVYNDNIGIKYWNSDDFGLRSPVIVKRIYLFCSTRLCYVGFSLGSETAYFGRG